MTSAFRETRGQEETDKLRQKYKCVYLNERKQSSYFPFAPYEHIFGKFRFKSDTISSYSVLTRLPIIPGI